MSKKIIKLTENDIYQLVKKVLREQPEVEMEKISTSETKRNLVKLENATKKEVEDFIGKLPMNAQYMALIDCEYADFSGFDVCITNLVSINLQGTPNNLMDQNFDCIKPSNNSSSIFHLEKKD